MCMLKIEIGENWTQSRQLTLNWCMYHIQRFNFEYNNTQLPTKTLFGCHCCCYWRWWWRVTVCFHNAVHQVEEPKTVVWEYTFVHIWLLVLLIQGNENTNIKYKNAQKENEENPNILRPACSITNIRMSSTKVLFVCLLALWLFPPYSQQKLHDNYYCRLPLKHPIRQFSSLWNKNAASAQLVVMVTVTVTVLLLLCQQYLCNYIQHHL